MSAHLQWAIIRNNNAFLVKRKHEQFSTEPNNLTNRHRFRFNGLVHRKTVGVEATKDNKGIVLSLKKTKYARKPNKNYYKTELKKNSRHSLDVIRRIMRKGRYRPRLTMAALRRASAILKSQRPVALKAPKKK